MTRLIRAASLAAAVGLVLGGCAPAGGPDVTNPPTSAATAPAADQGEQALGDAVLGNGRHPVYLKSIDVAQQQLTFDLIEFYTGDEAKAKWQQDHPALTEEPALNGYYIRNNNTRLRTLPLASGAQAKILDGEGSTDLVTVSLSEVKAPFTARPFWLTVFDGAVTTIEEQFVP